MHLLTEKRWISMEARGDKDRLYYNQVVLLIIVLRVMVGLTYMPSVNLGPKNQDIWIMLVLSIPYILILGLPLIYLSNKFNNLNWLEIGEKIMGKFLGKIIGIFYGLALIFISFLSIGTSIEILDTTLFLLTPTWFNTAIMVVTIWSIAHKGLKNIARVGEVVVPIVIFMMFFLIILGIKSFDYTELLPILGDSSFGDINKGAMEVALRFVDILILAMITPNLRDKKDLNKIYIRSIIYSIFIGAILVVATQMTLGVELTKHKNFPFLSFTRTITVARIQGFDAFYMFSWIMGNILRGATYLYINAVALGTLFNKRSQVFNIPLAITIFVLVVWVKDRRSILAVPEPTSTIVLTLSAIGILLIPTIMLVVYFFRRKKLNPRHKDS